MRNLIIQTGFRPKFICAVFLCVLCAFAVNLAGCQEKHKSLVTAHNAVGELLISTKAQTETLRTQGIINDQTYQSIRTNWLRAQKSYLEASDILAEIIDNNETDITAYTELITQVSAILSDVAIWLEEDKNGDTGNRVIGNATPTPRH